MDSTQDTPLEIDFSKVEIPPTCDCDRCVSMCHNVPCWGLPSEMQKIIDAGYGNKLRIELREGKNIVPMRVYEYDSTLIIDASIADHMGCVFLENKKCILHNQGLKPIEGVLAHCTENTIENIRPSILIEWQKDEGQKLLKHFGNIS